MRQLAIVAAAAIAGVLLAKHLRESTPPPADPAPRREVIQSPAPPPVVEEAARLGTPAPPEETPRWRGFYCPDCDEFVTTPKVAAPPEEPNVWYSNYNAACNVALETGRPLIIAIADERPDFEPPAGMVFCWLHTASAGPEWEPFDPPCVLRSDSMTPVFNPINLEDL